jgi:hypothetical protein
MGGVEGVCARIRELKLEACAVERRLNVQLVMKLWQSFFSLRLTHCAYFAVRLHRRNARRL